MIKPKPKNRDAEGLMHNTDRDAVLLFTLYEEKRIGAILKEGVLRKVFVEEEGLPLGSICIGKVSEIKEEFGAAFLMLKDRQKCFVHLSELKEEYNLTRPGEKVKCGDNFVIRIIKMPSKNKLASGTTVLKNEDEKLYEIALNRTDYSVLKSGKSYVELSFECFGELTDRDNIPGLQRRIITDLPEVYHLLKDSDFLDLDEYSVQLYEDKLVGLNVLFGLKGKISEALGRKVWLKSGADLIFDRTEAMTVIDVNSAKSSEDLLSVNLEAADEIVRQIALRNLSGIIMIDFINMKEEKDRTLLIEKMKENCLKYDRNLHVVDFTKLGIMETTRQKTGKALFELF